MQNIIEEITRVDRTFDTRVELSGELNDSCDYQYEDTKLAINQEQLDDYCQISDSSSCENLEDVIFEDVKDAVYVDSVTIHDNTIDTQKVKIDDLTVYEIDEILASNSDYKIKEITVTKKVLVKKTDEEDKTLVADSLERVSN